MEQTIAYRSKRSVVVLFFGAFNRVPWLYETIGCNAHIGAEMKTKLFDILTQFKKRARTFSLSLYLSHFATLTVQTNNRTFTRVRHHSTRCWSFAIAPFVWIQFCSASRTPQGFQFEFRMKEQPTDESRKNNTHTQLRISSCWCVYDARSIIRELL